MELNKFLSSIVAGNFDKDYIEIFGFKISLDDLLLLSLIFCLYKEGVEDQLLFICLILLLIS